MVDPTGPGLGPGWVRHRVQPGSSGRGAQQTGQSLASILISRNLALPGVVVGALAHLAQLPAVDLAAMTPSPEARAAMPDAVAQQFEAVAAPVRRERAGRGLLRTSFARGRRRPGLQGRIPGQSRAGRSNGHHSVARNGRRSGSTASRPGSRVPSGRCRHAGPRPRTLLPDVEHLLQSGFPPRPATAACRCTSTTCCATP